MTDFIDDDETGARKRALSNRQVLGFVARFWKRRPVLFSLGVGLTLVAISFDLALPYASGQLVDAVTRSRAAIDGRLDGAGAVRRRLSGLLGDAQHGHAVLDPAGRAQHGGDDQRGLRQGAGLLVRLARRQLRRRDGAQADPRHVGL
jgi:hypothetical protein